MSLRSSSRRIKFFAGEERPEDAVPGDGTRPVGTIRVFIRILVFLLLAFFYFLLAYLQLRKCIKPACSANRQGAAVKYLKRKRRVAAASTPERVRMVIMRVSRHLPYVVQLEVGSGYTI